MKLTLLYLMSWALGLISSIAFSRFYYGEPLSIADLVGFSTLSFVPALLICSLLYTPGLLWLRRRLGGCKPRLAFPLASALVLNMPAILIIGWQTGRTMRSSEALSFIVIFFVMGLASGLGFTLWCGRRVSSTGG